MTPPPLPMDPAAGAAAPLAATIPPARPAAALGLAFAAALALVSAGCELETFAPSSRIDEPRIIAVAAEPPVIPMDGDSALTVLVVDADGRDSSVDPARALDLDIRWRACNPWKPVFAPDRDCTGEDALPLASADDDSWQGRATVSVPEVLATFPPPPDVIDQIGSDPGDGDEDGDDGEEPCPHDYGFADLPVVVEVTAGERRVVALQRVRVTWDQVSRRSPIIDGLVFGDVIAGEADVLDYPPAAERRVTASMNREALDPVCLDGDPDQIAPEPVRYHAYATAGEFDEPEDDIEYQADGSESAGTLGWTAPAGGPVVMWLVATDSDGGVGWARFELRPGA